MKTLVAALMTALLVFALATGWTEFVQPKIDATSVAAKKPAAATTRSTAKRTTRRPAVQDTEDDELEADTDSGDEPARPVASKSSRSSKAAKDKDAATKAAKDQVMAQLNEVKQQESKLVAREEMLRMLYEDIRSELSAVENIRRQSTSELALAERRIAEASSVRKVTESASNDPDQPLSSAKSKASAEAKIASVVQDMARQGNVSAAAALLSGLKEREVAKILTTLSTRDPRLALQLSDRVQAAKQDTMRR